MKYAEGKYLDVKNSYKKVQVSSPRMQPQHFSPKENGIARKTLLIDVSDWIHELKLCSMLCPRPVCSYFAIEQIFPFFPRTPTTTKAGDTSKLRLFFKSNFSRDEKKTAGSELAKIEPKSNSVTVSMQDGLKITNPGFD